MSVSGDGRKALDAAVRRSQGYVTPRITPVRLERARPPLPHCKRGRVGARSAHSRPGRPPVVSGVAELVPAIRSEYVRRLRASGQDPWDRRPEGVTDVR
jgi:hypothetical protein